MALPNKTKIPVGTVLAAKYRITREIGRGGMAAVYHAENIDIGKQVAIKILAPELTTSTIVVERFLREARAVASIRSPYICDVYDSGKLADGRPFLVLELLFGESLYERMTKVRFLDVNAMVTVVAQVCRGLTKAHSASIVHRDLKPENIFLTKDEEGALLAKILDFGLAKFYTSMETSPEQARLTREGAVFGTPAYMSPEQVRGQGAADHRADLWAVGCIVYECLTGHTVWATEQGVAMTFAQIANAPTPRPNLLRPDLPPSFTAWFDKALHRDIDRRFQSAKELAEELAVALHTPIAALQSLAPAPSSGRSPPMARAIEPYRDGPALERALSAALAGLPDGTDGASVSPPLPTPPGFAGADLGPLISPNPSKLGFAAPQLPPDAAVAGKRAGAASHTVLGRAALALGAFVIFGGVVYGAWSKWAALPAPPPPPSSTTVVVAPPELETALPPASAVVAPSVIPDAAAMPWTRQVREAQQAIADGDLKHAAKLLKDAFDNGGHGVPRTMLEHVQIALGAGDHPLCQLTGLARPRSYDLAGARATTYSAGRPAIVLGPAGAVMTWTDGHEGPDHAYAIALDGAMRSSSGSGSGPVDVTPEGMLVGHPELLRAGDRLVLSYGDAKGAQTGVYARFLEPNGRIAGPPVALGSAPGRPGGRSPVIAATGDASFYAAWSDEGESDSEDLFLRRLGPDLAPRGHVIRVTDLAPAGPSRPRARLPSLAVARSAIHIAYRVERDTARSVNHMRLPLADADKGLEPLARTARSVDRTVGDVVLINNDRSKSDAPSLACDDAGCFIAWHGEGGAGASVAFIEPDRAEPLWRKKFSKSGGHPAVAVAGGRGQIVWFEAGKLVTASIGREGVGPPTRIARVSGEQPMPSIAAGSKPGEWYFAWLDYESGHLEAYGARVLCQ